MIPVPDVVADAHGRTADAVAAALSVDPGTGLTAAERDRRARRVGPNVLEAARGPSLPGMVVEAATEPFILLLAVAGIGAVLLGEIRDGLLVLLGLVPIVGADVVTEYRSERALEALRQATAPVARVRRDGRALDVPAADLVPGDIVLLKVGDLVPADVRLVRAERLLVDRSVLTGESIPEPAHVVPDPRAAALFERRSVAYAGTSVVGGFGEGVVIATGRGTEFGRVARGLATRERRRSPLQRELDRLVRILLVVAIALVTVTTGLGFLRGNPAGENILAGISAAIAAIPEEPPILLAVVLGLGAYRLLRRGVLVRRLNAQEMLGAIDLIVTDKTGTLTENRLTVSSIRTPDGPLDRPIDRSGVLADAVRAEEDAWRVRDGVRPGSFTRCLLAAIDSEGGRGIGDDEHLLDAEPASEARPVAVTRSTRDGRVRDLAFGAPEAVLRLAAALDATERAAWAELVDRSAESGERLLLLAGRDVPDGAAPPPWRPMALVGFADPPRSGIGEALSAAREAGIRVVVVTGDHPRTAAALARSVGLAADRVVNGRDLEAWPEDRLRADLMGLDVVARATPDVKLRIVDAARAAGRTLAVTGDGVNDAPALQHGDVAVAMGSGTAVAKEASDLVLGDDSFATLMGALGEGRRIVDNVQKGLVFLVSTHVALLGFVLIATLAGFDQPLLPIQILWLELFIDVSASVAFEREPAEPGLMSRPPRPRDRPLLDAGILARIVGAGGFSAAAALVLMATHPGPFDDARWLAFSALVAAQAVRAYGNRSLGQPVVRLPPNRFLLAIAVLVVLIQGVIPSVPPLAEAFRATSLDLRDWAVIAVVAVAPAVLADAVRATGRRWIA